MAREPLIVEVPSRVRDQLPRPVEEPRRRRVLRSRSTRPVIASSACPYRSPEHRSDVDCPACQRAAERAGHDA